MIKANNYAVYPMYSRTHKTNSMNTYTSNNIIKPNEYEILITQFGSLLISTR